MMSFNLNNCRICGRNCGVDRTKTFGFCNTDIDCSAAAICVHKGEEPVLSGSKGVCNVFFPHCNLRCVFCQNKDISTKEYSVATATYTSLSAVVDRIEELLQTTEQVLGFVSPSHYAYNIPAIVDCLRNDGFNPTVVYNTNAYDSVDTLRKLESYIDVYLPDFKYCSSYLSGRYSSAPNYFEVASKALKEMYRQKGSTLITADNDIALSGLIIRHLILPGCVDDSKDVLSWIAENISSNVHFSLMSQYYPIDNVALPDQLTRKISVEEYNQVVDHFYALGFHNGWVQDLDERSYKPDFSKKEAFECSDRQ